VISFFLKGAKSNRTAWVVNGDHRAISTSRHRAPGLPTAVALLEQEIRGFGRWL